MIGFRGLCGEVVKTNLQKNEQEASFVIFPSGFAVQFWGSIAD